MNEILKVSYENDRVTVSARELHKFLEVGTEFRHWFPRMTEYGIENGTDYTPVIFDHPQNHQPTQDYQLTLDAAKEICMLQRNEKGKQARQYFIEVEKRYNSPEYIMHRAMKYLDTRVKELETQIEELSPKALYADAVSASTHSILIGELAKILKQNGLEIGQNRLFEKLRNDGYLVRGKHRSDRNMPTQRAMEMGLFEINESTITNSDGHILVTKTPKITGKGRIYFVNKFLAN